MQVVYFFREKTKKDLEKILREDSFMRISYTIIESDKAEGCQRALASGQTAARSAEPTVAERKGYFLYAQENPDEADLMEKRFKEIEVEKLTGEEEQLVINKITKNEENAASGMGMIFG